MQEKAAKKSFPRDNTAARETDSSSDSCNRIFPLVEYSLKSNESTSQFSELVYEFQTSETK